MRRRLVLTAAVTLACAGCSLSGAGSGDRATSASPASASSTSPRSAVRTAVAALRRDSASFRQEIELRDGGQEYGLTVTGGFDFAADSGHLTVDLPGGAIDHSDEVFADGKIYISAAEGAGEDAWGVMAREEAQAHYLLRAPLNDPEHVLKQIAAMREVSMEGEDDVRGVRAVHYRGILDHRTATLDMAPDVRANTDQARDALGADLPIFADAWIDTRGRLVRTRMNLNLSGTQVTTTMTLSDIGEPVRVTVPRAADAVPVTGARGILSG
ncbi:hypothetical protein ACIPSE_11625 [Streptomyces sp. NPDC090106]|uniref:hypothetical protein n=1 Tax=Streptomyces sp. NPDC090106 TaxID=3365946 RepID=UPI0037FF2D95